MKFIIFISSRIRNGQPVRHPDFSYDNQLGLYIYQGRLLDAAEFNEAAARVFTERYLTKGLTFAPKVIEVVAVEAVAPPTEPEPPAEHVVEYQPPSPEAKYVVAVDPEPTEPPSEPVAPVPDTPRVPTRRPKKSAESETS